MNFNTIPNDLRVPLFYAEIDNSAANTAQDTGPALIIAHALAGSTIEPNKLVIMPSAGQAGQVAGRGSQLARMVSAYRAVDPFGELWVIATPEPAGAPAAGKLTITGTAQAAGALSIYVGTTRVQVIVAALDSPLVIGASIAAAINALPDLPVRAEVQTSSVVVTGAGVQPLEPGTSLSIVNITAKNSGQTGNTIPITMNYRGSLGGEQNPDGVNVAITPMAGGAGAPNLSAAIAAMGDEPFDFIAFPFCDSASLSTIGAEMNDDTGRWSWSRQLYGHVYTAKKGALSDLVAFGSTFNDPHLTIAGYELGVQVATDELVAARTARNAVFIRNDPARPTQTGLLNGALPAPAGDRFILTEQQSLLTHGIATAYSEGGVMRIQRDITTYRKNAYGNADNSFLDSETLHTSAYVLRRLKSVITSKYGRHKLANDGTRFGPGQAIVTPNVIRGEILAVYRQLERAAIVENFDLFAQYLIVERNANDPNRLDVLFPPDYVNQLRVFALLNQFRLQYQEESV
ncbi:MULTISPECIES: phage tail sheath subtilisin-like domain-containing protein [unclassified Serratia (in: enterobacteria)]|uniref:phage tail sheath subtilisin-like domain-containing protein n=1 Tax=unclassified Serratia (in: enterobacteria) TaxID=2647522 RepID=UPI0005067235|nr:MULTISPECIES: phage tail sheath subtilisin-like domain-containing protein [unclassified Serratia (in: enterobacteria)]KFK95021.1 tail sheath protein [Serratia sp. Ag1]KFK96688.1 tail sheath protein [Serratia sp. Ag2]